MIFIFTRYTLKMNKIAPLLIISLISLLNIHANSSIFCQEITKDIAVKKAEYYLKTLQIFYAEGDYETHKLYSDSLLSVAKQYGLTKMHILALNNQAVFYKNRGEQLKAIELYHEALDKCKLIPEDHRSKVIVLINMGNSYRNIGSYNKSIEVLEKVLSMLDTYQDFPKIRAAALIGIANSYSELENYQKDIEYSLKAIEIAKQINNDNILVTVLSNICESYINLKQYEKALEYSRKAFRIHRSKKQTKQRAWLLLSTGRAYSNLNTLDSNYTKKRKIIKLLLKSKKRIMQ